MEKKGRYVITITIGYDRNQELLPKKVLLVSEVTTGICITKTLYRPFATWGGGAERP